VDRPLDLPPLNIPELLQKHGLRPDKRLGQNYLVDTGALKLIVEAAGVQAGDSILEIGPGLGSLTRYLAAAARHVTAVELDGRLIPALREVLEPFPNVRIVEGDILLLDPAELMGDPPMMMDDPAGLIGDPLRLIEGTIPQASEPEDSAYVVVANIPYYITSPLIRHLLEARLRPARLTLTVQQEVAERITAEAGEMSLLALSVQVYGRPGIAARIPAGAFYPSPQVDSAVVRVEIFAEPLFPPPVLETVFRLAKAGFSQKRKMLRNSLAAGMHMPPAQAEVLLTTAGIEPTRRAETLSLEEWGQLASAVRG
jgi:16S rRNA (adenine1518-N6/adenine1519-N6)-dimethyltransferase